MGAETIALAILNAARPAGIAATYALLSSARPRVLLGAYLLVGFAWSAVIGLVVVGFLGEVRVGTGDSAINDLVDLLAGIALLGFAVGLASGRLAGDAGAEPGPSRLERRLRDPSVAVAAGAGLLTHLPGLFYLLGLNTILAGDPRFVDGVFQVLVFNGIWFAVPLAAFVFSIRDPVATRRLLGRLASLGRRHGRTLVIVLAALVGTYFTVRGGLDLFG